MNEEQSLGDSESTTPPAPPRKPALASLAEAAVETVLDLDEVMDSARAVERTAKICLRGDLQEQYDATLLELSQLVDIDGNVVTDGEAGLADQSKAQQLADQAASLQADISAATRVIRFRAMSSDGWEAFVEKHTNKTTNQAKDALAYANELISRCAFEPTLSVTQVQQLRTKLSANQMTELFQKALKANTEGGLSIPKSPSFLVGMTQQESATN